jgi:hypothetical protein
VVGTEAVVAAGTVVDGGEAAGMEDTTADGAIGTQDIIVGTADGAGGAAVGTLGGLFRCQSLTLILTTADTDMGRDMATVQATVMVQVMGTGTEEDTDLDGGGFP